MSPRPRHASLARLATIGVIAVVLGVAMYGTAIVISLVRLVVGFDGQGRELVAAILWYSGLPTSAGLICILLDLFVLLPLRRRYPRHIDVTMPPPDRVAVALTAYNDEDSIEAAVADFRSSPLVSRVIVVDNNSRDRTAERARAAGAEVVTETRPGYGRCVFRCLNELRRCEEEHVVLCEGDMTFRARDLEKLVAFAHHADIVNGTRIVEQLRALDTQLSTFMYYGNFFVGKLLEVKHLGRGTFTDVGTTYKLIRREALPTLMPELNPAINLEFNAHFMDRCLTFRHSMVECPVTFHARVGKSKGGNTGNTRALRVGLLMIVGLLSDWWFWPSDQESVSAIDAQSTRE